VRVTVPKPLWNPWPYKGPCCRGNILQLIFALGALLFLLGVIRRIATARFFAYRRGRSWSGNPRRPLTFRDPSGSLLFTIEQDPGRVWMLKPAGGQNVTIGSRRSYNPVQLQKNMRFECGQENEYGFDVTMLSSGRVQIRLASTPFPDEFLGRARRLIVIGIMIILVQQIIARFF